MGIDFGEFRDDHTMVRSALKKGGYAFDDGAIRELTERIGSGNDIVHCHNELLWRTQGRPYYKVWPSICHAFSEMDLGKMSARDTIRGIGEFGPMEVRFPKGVFTGPDGGNVDAAFVCAGGQKVVTLDAIRDGCVREDHMGSVTVNFRDADGAMTYVRLDDSPTTLEQEIDFTLELLGEDYSPVVKVALLVAMIPKDDSIIDRDVLARDADRYRVTLDPLLVEKAVRKGKNGWNVGRDAENAPHYRRPHPALYWTGKGRRVPKVVFRSGALVHREKVAKVPTGYGGGVRCGEPTHGGR